MPDDPTRRPRPRPELSAGHVEEIARMLYEWHPSEELRADNGYGFYGLNVYTLLRGGHDVDRVASFLGRTRTEEIGLPPDPESDRETARQLVEWWGRQ